MIGYARVSTGEQTLDPQIAELKAAGCDRILEEQASGGDRERPVLRRLIEKAGPGDVIVVVRLDRLARSLSHLLEVIETLERRGAHFRSLRDPVDTSSPQGKFTLQVLGAAAELERALIRERTVAGLASARSQGRIGGNPGLRRKDKGAIRKVVLARDDAHMERLMASAGQWVAVVTRNRPHMPWSDVLRLVNHDLPRGTPEWTLDRLKRAVKRYVREGMLAPTVLGRAPTRPESDRLLAIVAAMANARPRPTLQEMCDKLVRMRERTPRGRSAWYPSSVSALIVKAERNGLIEPL